MGRGLPAPRRRFRRIAPISAARARAKPAWCRAGAGRRSRCGRTAQNGPSTALGVAAGMDFHHPRRGRCAGRGQPQQSLRSCRYSGHGAPFSRLAALRAHLHDGGAAVRGSYHRPPLGDQAAARQGRPPGTRLRKLPAHPTEQAPPAPLGDRGAPGSRGRRCRAGSRAHRTRRSACRRAQPMRGSKRSAWKLSRCCFRPGAERRKDTGLCHEWQSP